MSGPVLVLDAALEGCLAAVVDGDRVTELRSDGGRGSSAALPMLAASVLQAAGIVAPGMAGVVVTIGPGSFTGVRAALALGHGIALAAGVALVGVTVGDAIRAGLGEDGVWVAVGNGRGRVFLDDGESIRTVDAEAPPAAVGRVRVAGGMAGAVTAAMRARGDDVTVLDMVAPTAAGIAAAARHHPRAALPLYVDPVAARPMVGAAAGSVIGR